MIGLPGEGGLQWILSVGCLWKCVYEFWEFWIIIAKVVGKHHSTVCSGGKKLFGFSEDDYSDECAGGKKCLGVHTSNFST